ncbi:hypothetical protein HQK08_07670 [Blautia massiliensis]|uniref:tail fiber domain-containing protein n=1 Tax=Blautia massiliensis (ex Durand et al. 2017) TaxID=1737424 RepID=UPI001570B2D3|nr:tail fiber domain-containing protein [Blautia massiliensis (ex Durand et al. 2017)]NSK79793.1 hypothetical protein [Blautia massiliensis (ex Durand et al. 2017)]
MIDTSAAYKEAIKKNRILHHEAKIEFSDGTALTPQDQDLYTFKISENTSNEKSFDLGSAIAKQLDLKINNIDGEYSKHKFSGAKITARVGLEISGKTEWLKKGVFYADPGKTAGDTISVTAVDGMTKFDVSYSKSGLSYPATLGNIVRDACSVCGITMSPEIASFEKSDFVVTNRPVDSSLTFRNILQFVGEIACLNFKMNADDQLTASWYDTNLLESETAEAAIKVEHYSGTIETDDVVITGVKVTEESVSDSDTEEKNETEYIYGSTGYVLEIRENKLIQEGNGASVAEYVGRKVNGITFRPVSIHTQGDPSIEAGDIAVITDRKGNKYKTILTGVTYTAKAQQDLICGAESPAEQSAVRYSKATQVYRELRKTVAKQKTEFEKSLETLKTAMGEKRGLYPVTEILEDGSSILYFCDQDTVAESKIVVKLNASGWGMSTDGGKTWNTGVLVDGTMIAKILNTIGINADWINTGAIEVKTEGGETIFRVDMDSKSVYMSGDVQIGGKKFSESIDNAITDSKNYTDSKLADYSKTVADSLEGLQGQIDGQIESYYYEYEPTLQNIPASEWTTTEERKKHEGDLFFWKPNKDTGEGGYAYRFLCDSSVGKWEWVLVQDTDITKALAAAQNAQDTADGKRRTFIVTPYPPYDIGDTWNQEDGDILTCVVARTAGTSYVSTDWRKLNKYTDDTVAEEAKKVAEQAKEAAALAKNMVLTLSNDSQSITVDADGKYNTFPTTVTQATVMYGSTDISVDCEYEITKSTGITGNWNKSNRIYTVTGLSENSGWVEIKATYINTLTVSKRFTVQKVYAGTDGTPGRTYIIELSAYAAKRGADGEVSPSSVTAYAYYRDGAETRKTYSGRWKIQISTDGSTWTDSWTSTSNATSTTKNLKNAEYNFVKFILYEANGTTNELDTQTFLILTDTSALTQEKIVKILSDNGAWKGLYYSNNRLYISFDAALGGILTLGGPNNGNGQLKIYGADGKLISRLGYTGYVVHDKNAGNPMISLNTAGLRLFTDYTDLENYNALMLGKYGLYAQKVQNKVTELWLEGDTSKKWEGYIIRYLNNKVRINTNSLFTDGCELGANFSTDGSATIDKSLGVGGNATVNGTLTFYDLENQAKTSGKVKRQPVASVSADDSQVAYLSSGTGRKYGDTATYRRLGIRAKWGGSGFNTDYLYTTAQVSDIRLKENIKNSETDALETVNRMKVRQFDWKERMGGWHQNIGFVADELEEIDPNLALGGGYDENGEMDIKQVNSPYLLSYAIKAIQELSVIVENQNKRIEKLERRLS